MAGRLEAWRFGWHIEAHVPIAPSNPATISISLMVRAIFSAPITRLPPLTRKSDGLPVGAVQGFCNMLWKLLKEMKAGEKPTHLAVDLRQIGEILPQ